MKDVKLYEWPENQACVGCIHSASVISNILEGSTNICLINYSREGAACEKRESDDTEDDEQIMYG